MTKKDEIESEEAQAVIKALAPIGRDLARGIFNVLSSLAQASAASPIVATAATIIIADFLAKFKIINPNASAIAIGAVTGMSVAKVAGGIIEDIIPNLPGTTASTSTNLTYDIPDMPGDVPPPTIIRQTDAEIDRDYNKRVRKMRRDYKKAHKDIRPWEE